MTTVFVYEACCALASGDKSGSSALSLDREGRAMRDAVAGDIGRIPGVVVRTLDAVPVEAEFDQFRELAAACDWTLVIAPELGGELYRRCETVERVGGRLLGPPSTAVARTASKLALARTWERYGVPTPRTMTWHSWMASPRYPVVVKPDDGAGSTATFLIDTPDDLSDCLEQAREEGYDETRLLVQEFCPGRPASVAFLAGAGRQVPLQPAVQFLSSDHRMHYEGGATPVPPELAERAVRLGHRASACIPGWLGYFGVDLILGEDEDGSGDRAIEINPRLTTSYVGLRVLADFNLGEVMVRTAQGERVEGLSWRPGGVRFWPDGSVSRIAETDYRF